LQQNLSLLITQISDNAYAIITIKSINPLLIKEEMRMICPKCSTELLLDYTFCPQCGSKLPSQEVQPDTTSTDAEKSAADEAFASGSSTQSDSIFVSSSPLSHTMPSPFVSNDSSAFAAPPDASQETFVSAGSTADTYAAAASPYAETSVIQNAAVSASSAVPAAASYSAPDADKSYSAPSQKTESSKTTVPPTAKTEPVIPKEYKALSTAGIFWYLFLISIPVVGWIILLSFALGGKNKSKKSLSRAVLIYWIIFILLFCSAFIVAFIFNSNLLVQLTDSNNWVDLGDYIYQMFINH